MKEFHFTPKIDRPVFRSNGLIRFICLPRRRDELQFEDESEALQDSLTKCPAKTVKDCNGTYSEMVPGEV